MENRFASWPDPIAFRQIQFQESDDPFCRPGITSSGICGSVLVNRDIRDWSAKFKREGYTSVEVSSGNGYFGWPEHAPFDQVIVTTAPDLIPPPLINQLRAGDGWWSRSDCPTPNSFSLTTRTSMARLGRRKSCRFLVARGTRRACLPSIVTWWSPRFPDDEVARSPKGVPGGNDG